MSREVCGTCWCPYDDITGDCACPPSNVQKSTLRQAAQQALDALYRWHMTDGETAELMPAFEALRAALAEPVQEPVAWVECDGELVWNNREAAIGRNLYASPPPRKPLTDEEILSLFRTSGSPVEFARAIERAHGIK